MEKKRHALRKQKSKKSILKGKRRKIHIIMEEDGDYEEPNEGVLNPLRRP